MLSRSTEFSFRILSGLETLNAENREDKIEKRKKKKKKGDILRKSDPRAIEERYRGGSSSPAREARACMPEHTVRVKWYEIFQRVRKHRRVGASSMPRVY